MGCLLPFLASSTRREGRHREAGVLSRRPVVFGRRCATAFGLRLVSLHTLACFYSQIKPLLLLLLLPPHDRRDLGAYFLYWCLLFVLIRQGLRGGSGPQRLIRALGEETGNPIMAFHRPSFFPSAERAPLQTTTAENPFFGCDHSPEISGGGGRGFERRTYQQRP